MVFETHMVFYFQWQWPVDIKLKKSCCIPSVPKPCLLLLEFWIFFVKVISLKVLPGIALPCKFKILCCKYSHYSQDGALMAPKISLNNA